VARSANTGISAFINQRGDIVQQTKWWVQGAIKQDINLNGELSFYVRFGDYIARVGSIGSGIFAFILVVSLLKKRSSKVL